MAKHPNNPYKGYVGHPLLVKLGYHQTIFPAAFVPFLKQYDNRVKDGSGSSLKQLERVIDQGQPVIIYHTSLGARPFTACSVLIINLLDLYRTFMSHY